MPIKECQTTEDFEEILLSSADRPVFLFKHSSACGASEYAWTQFTQYAVAERRADYWRVLVIEQRSLAREIARRSGVAHASPQVLLFQAGRVRWHTSHWRIRTKALQQALQSAFAG